MYMGMKKDKKEKVKKPQKNFTNLRKIQKVDKICEKIVNITTRVNSIAQELNIKNQTYGKFHENLQGMSKAFDDVKDRKNVQIQGINFTIKNPGLRVTVLLSKSEIEKLTEKVKRCLSNSLN